MHLDLRLLKINTGYIMKNRPQIKTIKNTNTTSETELFQNYTLRPIIKQQSDLLRSFLDITIQQNNVNFPQLSLNKQQEYIETLFLKNLSFKNRLIGIVIGNFSKEEFYQYSKNEKELNKRVLQIIKNRMLSFL